MTNIRHNEAITRNLIHMGTDRSEWSVLSVEGFTTTEHNGKMKVMPEYKFPAGYSEAPTLYKSDGNNSCCGWCGHKIMNVFWIVNHSRKWLLPVGSECIKGFIELTSEQVEELKAISTVKLEEVEQINIKIKQGITVKEAITATKKHNTIEKRFLKRYPEPDQDMENWWKSIIDKWDHSWYSGLNKDFQYWGLKWEGLYWPMKYDYAYNYLRLPKPNTETGKTAYELWEDFKTRYIEKKLKA